MSLSNYSATDLIRFLDHGAVPIYVLDEDRQVVFCNAACARWLGIGADAILGLRCGYHAPRGDVQGDPSPADIVAGLCPPPEVFAGQVRVALVSCERAGGRVSHRRGHFLPLATGEDESAPVIAILETVDCAPDAHVADGESSQELHELVRRYRKQLAGRFVPERLAGNSPAIVRARAQIDWAAAAGVNVLVVGPVGSGKEQAAKAIHYGQKEPGLLVPLDCGLMDANLLRSTLRTLCVRRNLRPAASTLLLENVAAMPPEVQQELIEILREGTLGMRILSTTTIPLREALADGVLAEPLAYALSTLVIELPALSERIEDFPLLLQSMVEEFNRSRLRQMAGFSPEAIDQLAAHCWPGNFNELEALVGELHEKSQGPVIQPRDLPKTVHWRAEGSHASHADEPIVLEEFLARVEKELIARAMRRAKGNKSRAAKLLGMTRPKLYRRLVLLGLEAAKPSSQERPAERPAARSEIRTNDSSAPSNRPPAPGAE